MADDLLPALTNAERAVLDLATEDAFGLWDLLWYLRAALGLDEGPARAVAVDAVAALRERGLVELFTSDAPGAPGVPVNGAAIDIASLELWRRPAAHDAEVLVAATGAGEQAFRALDRRRHR